MTRLGAWILLALVFAACGVTSGVPPERRAPAIALVGGRVQPSPEATTIPDGVVLIEGGVITAVGDRSGVRVPSGATVIDCTGATVMAGFWNSHVHFTQAVWNDAESARPSGLRGRCAPC